jgi:hypothetical protein
MAVGVFETQQILENSPMPVQANFCQAMHIAYACLGRIDIAKKLLERAEHCALAAGKGSNIFSVKTYGYVSIQDFLLVNKDMRTALENNQLWDGLKIIQS